MTTPDASPPRWQFRVDRGGTFTDVVARAPDGALHTLKLLSENPGHYADATVEAMHRITATPHGTSLPPAELRLGTTVATNALLERKGEPTLLAITRGFTDALAIGTQERPDIFARAIQRAAPLAAAAIPITERVTASGEVLIPLDLTAARAAFAQARAQGFTAIAIALIHGWRYPAHEQALAALAAELGFSEIVTSHQTAATIRLIPRAGATVADAYLSPVLARYVETLRAGLGPNVETLFMQSTGALAPAQAFRGKNAILSGPAGGIVGLAAVARSLDADQRPAPPDETSIRIDSPAFGPGEQARSPHSHPLIGFDMGGTSTDVSYYAGHFEREAEAEIAGLRLALPMMRIETVAAGGGSICGFDGARLTVGPHSAGAVPGPACYRRGGPLTVTDCNLILGRLQPGHFPPSFGPNADQPLDPAAAAARADALCAEIAAATGRPMSRAQLAEGCLAIAVANMAHAIKAVTLRRGHDVARAALVSFGGAGGQHACAVAEALGMASVIAHPFASLLSAWGMGLATRGASRSATIALPLDAAHGPALAEALADLATAAGAELAHHGAPPPFTRHAEVTIRPASSDNGVELTLTDTTPDPATLATRFAAQWQARFGYAATGALIVEQARVEVTAANARTDTPPALPTAPPPPPKTVTLTADGRELSRPLHQRASLPAGFVLHGPALIVDPVSTLYVAPGWHAEVEAGGNIVMRRDASAQTPAKPATIAGTDAATPDPVALEIMGGLFMGLAEEMGAALRFSAASVNIRERLDYSCALFDASGQLIANAPHMPVHLGSMGDSVRAVIAGANKDTRSVIAGATQTARPLRPGDAFALNAPHAGGTHLPDITVVMPVFATSNDATPAWFVAARGHHADVGGISPGSMPSRSTTLAQEGAVLDNLLILEDGQLREEALRAALANSPWPARNPDQNIADIAAQIAACRRGAAGLLGLAAHHTRATIDAYMAHLQDYSEARVRALLATLADGAFTLTLDMGATIALAFTIDRAQQTAHFDFTGTSPAGPHNFNAPPGVTRAAVLYALRCLIDVNVPLNDGFLRPIRITIPSGSLLAPPPGAAVVAGNVETSQALTDAIFAALGAMAAAQGTMNNFTFGDATHQYYETIAGGSGAGILADGSGYAGTGPVQTHMTNSRLTDPEILESRYPVLLEEFSERRGSGGTGRWPGGNGARRRIRFLAAMQAEILSGRRTTAPFGLHGGGDALAGENRILRADGSVESLPGCASAQMAPGDVFEILTPGGGGYGAPDPAPTHPPTRRAP